MSWFVNKNNESNIKYIKNCDMCNNSSFKSIKNFEKFYLNKCERCNFIFSTRRLSLLRNFTALRGRRLLWKSVSRKSMKYLATSLIKRSSPGPSISMGVFLSIELPFALSGNQLDVVMGFLVYPIE